MNSPIRRLAVALAATALSATLLHFGTGLTPVPWLTWLAPLPVLVLAHHAGARTTFLAASAAWLGGETAMWGYFLGTVQIPPPTVVSLVVGSALLFGLVVLSSRALVLRGRPLTAAAVVPAAWVAVEYAFSVLSPNGAWWSLAYTQADVLPVLQTVSVTGPWGVTFLVLGVPAAVAVFFAPRAAGRLRVAVAAATILALALGYGAWRLRAPYGEGAEKVALLATDRMTDGWVPVASAEGRALLGRYTARIPGLAARGARVVVMPEKVFIADDATLPVLAAPLARLAADHHVDIIAGLILKRSGVLRNAAVDFPADGSRPVEYFKHHLIPGLESDFQPGDRKAFVPGSGLRWAIAICFDLDLPGLVRDYRRSGATALFVPGWDFGQDRWLHGRMAVTRGVETGLTVARAARDGDLVVSDANGRIRTEAHSADAPFVSVLAALPSGSADTLYTRFGDWFAWACALLLLLALASLTRIRAAAGGHPSGRGTQAAGDDRIIRVRPAAR
ncbi:nitrilase-related carbon-nitrogen hydrolase [Microbispora amethystogenes]|uniref:Apolipoprotein N-acyltransferase n=1 Tax=Microbispora amethystogenes TaxID=1427754 RepID=A0ABQ4FED2_9ACTN|nr:nitrilase-related carbon-nitrogen hydrolase [Microbispora amethystogenes]GIH33181.1 apolipoprotein N-acyltransferase [Microbispora amethystogenes]